ncbi:hypothetical protein [Photorhabdus luminescens]|uniref:Uncharacterized protein n=1 Tax=Photorhabdus luminescens subsp. sonorensis TaxID=1173677 RepID=A0A5C4RLC4_PHOLU|nr:hypothetical protein [Photorhabdus luminescens]TNH44618.1 hypothetical protein EP164_05355 [Photorhabdus luminescens subsp. sonorensis]
MSKDIIIGVSVKSSVSSIKKRINYYINNRFDTQEWDEADDSDKIITIKYHGDSDEDTLKTLIEVTLGKYSSDIDYIVVT